MKGFIIALQFLTRLPTVKLTVSREEFVASIRWFPAVGLVIGALLTLAGRAGAHIDSGIGALAALILWVIITGTLHLDGLGDIADASGAAHNDRGRLLAVLADPHVGSFGVTSIAAQLLTKLMLLRALIERDAFWALALIPFAARIGPLLWSLILPSLHAGLGEMFGAAVRWQHLILWGSLLLIAALTLSPSLLAAPLILLLWACWIKSKIGGISGDGHGGGIEICETLLLLAALLWAHWA